MDAQGYRDEITGGAPGYANDNVSISSGSLSPRLGEARNVEVRVSKESELGQ